MNLQTNKFIRTFEGKKTPNPSYLFSTGFEQGTNWANTNAGRCALLSVSSMVCGGYHAFLNNAATHGSKAYEWFAIFMAGPEYKGCAHMFWYDLIGDSPDLEIIEDERFVLGFMDGARTAFSQNLIAEAA